MTASDVEVFLVLVKAVVRYPVRSLLPFGISVDVSKDRGLKSNRSFGLVKPSPVLLKTLFYAINNIFVGQVGVVFVGKLPIAWKDRLE